MVRLLVVSACKRLLRFSRKVLMKAIQVKCNYVRSRQIAWDNTAKQVNTPDTGRFPIGIGRQAARSGVTSVAVFLDGVATTAA
jgi:hypothetical protein